MVVESARTAKLASDEASSDDAVVRRILAGEKLLFALLLRRYNPRLFRIARAIVCEELEAEDVVQYAYVTAYGNLSQYRGGAKFSTWLSRIAINEACGRLRKNKRRSELSMLEARQSPSVSKSDPEQEAYRREIATLLEGQIDALAEHLRLVFMLRDVQELSTKETAEVLNTSEEAVRIRLHRARQQLQQLLTQATVATPYAFHLSGASCDRIAKKVFFELQLLETVTTRSTAT